VNDADEEMDERHSLVLFNPNHTIIWPAEAAQKGLVPIPGRLMEASTTIIASNR